MTTPRLSMFILPINKCHSLKHYFRSQAAAIAKSTGCKGTYPLLKLKYHDPIKQTVPDAMHTIKDAIEHFFYLIVGKDDCSKTVQSELELERFLCKRNGEIVSTTPYKMSKEEKKIADTRASSVICPQHVDFSSSAFFSKTHFKSHDWKQVFV